MICVNMNRAAVAWMTLLATTIQRQPLMTEPTAFTSLRVTATATEMNLTRLENAVALVQPMLMPMAFVMT